MENTQTIENQDIKSQKQQQFVEMLMDTPACRGCEIVETVGVGNGVQVLKEKISFVDFDVMIIRSQWTKTQGGFAIRVPNYSTGKRHNLQIPVQTMRQCREHIQELKDNGITTLWTNHTIKVDNSNFKK